jgi:hypothetical protein
LASTPLQLAWLFLLYELAGIVTNLAAGWLAARFGLAATLYAGLALQVGSLVALAQLDPGWSLPASVVFVMAVQGVSGVAKDLAKMSSKSAVKLLAPNKDGGLFRWVALLTGSKNAVKGLGFFLGAALLALAGFQAAVWGMAGVLALILAAVILFLPAGLPGRMKADEAWGGWRSRDARVNRLSAGPPVPVRRARCLVRGRHPGLFPGRSVGWHARRAARGVLRDRRLPGALDHRLWRGAGPCPPPSGRQGPASGRDHPQGDPLGRAAGADPLPAGRGGLGRRRTRAVADRNAGRWPLGVRLRLRRQRLGPFLPDPGLSGRPNGSPATWASTTWPMPPAG